MGLKVRIPIAETPRLTGLIKIKGEKPLGVRSGLGHPQGKGSIGPEVKPGARKGRVG